MKGSEKQLASMGVLSPWPMMLFMFSPLPMLKIMNLSLLLSARLSGIEDEGSSPEGALGAHRKILEDEPEAGLAVRIIELEGVD